MKKILILIILGLLIWGGKWYYNSMGEGEPETNGRVRKEEIIVNKEKIADWWELSGVEMTDLSDVSGGRGEGMGYLVREDDGLMHRVEASLPKLDGDNFYEGWLVRKSPTLEFFSTGEMVIVSEEQYLLEHESDQEYPGYDQVVITLETKHDEIPEKHVLEGMLK